MKNESLLGESEFHAFPQSVCMDIVGALDSEAWRAGTAWKFWVNVPFASRGLSSDRRFDWRVSHRTTPPLRTYSLRGEWSSQSSPPPQLCSAQAMIRPKRLSRVMREQASEELAKN